MNQISGSTACYTCSDDSFTTEGTSLDLMLWHTAFRIRIDASVRPHVIMAKGWWLQRDIRHVLLASPTRVPRLQVTRIPSCLVNPAFQCY